jgi:hypothetical protein
MAEADGDLDGDMAMGDGIGIRTIFTTITITTLAQKPQIHNPKKRLWP